MIVLPSISRAVPAVYTTANEDASAARCALLLAPKGPIAPLKGRKAPVELAHLERMLHGWMERATQGLKIFEPKLHLSVDRAPPCECTGDGSEPSMSLWLINRDSEPWNARWRMDRRWQEIHKQAPGMPAEALMALEAASVLGLPIYTPHTAIAYCSWIHWHGADDEQEALMNWEDGMTVEKAEAQGFPTRRWLEKKLPPIAKEYKRGISRKRLAQSWGPHRDVASAILEVYAAIKANTPPRGAHRMHKEQDDYCCVGYGITLRWNEEDPMAQLFDDYSNSMYESHNVQEHYGWFPIANPARQLQPTLAAIERCFNIARAAEKLVGLIAEEVP